MRRRNFIKSSFYGALALNFIPVIKGKLRTIPVNESFFTSSRDTLYTWLGMAGAMINCRGTIILIDPLISYGADTNTCETGDKLLVPHPVTADKITRVDYVCYTHADSDHFAEKTARILNERLAPVFICPTPIYEKLQKLGVEGNRLIKIRDFATYTAGKAEIYITPAVS